MLFPYCNCDFVMTSVSRSDGFLEGGEPQFKKEKGKSLAVQKMTHEINTLRNCFQLIVKFPAIN